MKETPKIWICILLAIWFPLGEVHRLWRNDYSQYDVFVNRDMLIDVAWLAKYLSIELQNIVVAIVLCIVLKTLDRMLFKISLVYLFFCITELALFFWDFKQSSYVLIYAELCAALIFIVFGKKNRPMKS